MQKEGHKVWSGILSVLKQEVSASNYKTWFATSRVLNYKGIENGKILIIAVANNFVKEQIEKRFSKQIAEISYKQDLGNVEIIFVVSAKEVKESSAASPLFTGIAQQYVSSGKFESLNPAFTLDNFVVGSSNNLAYLAAANVSENPGGSYNPFLVYGPTGVGKTHIIQGIGNNVLSGIANAKVLYATSEKFTNDFLAALRGSCLPAFRQKYRNLNLLIIDDIQFLAGKESTQDEFFHTFNELILGGGQVVLAADRHPKDLGKLKERIVSRFLGGMVADIGLPDLETRMLMIKIRCEQNKIDLDLQVVEHVASEYVSARELEGALTSIFARIKFSGGAISADTLLESVNTNRVLVTNKTTSREIISAVSKYYAVGVDELKGSSRKSGLVFARQVAMYMLRQKLGLPLEEVGNLLGGRDHSTVIYGVDKIDKEIKINNSLRDDVLRVQAHFNNHSTNTS